MRNILVLLAHPKLEHSKVISSLSAALSDFENVEINDLYEQYPDYNIDVQHEQERLISADIIIWMHPLYWYAAPPLLKQWIDLVLPHGVLCGMRYLPPSVVSGFSVPLAKRLGLGSVPGYLVAGVLIGPFVLGLVGQKTTDVMHFAEFGVVMMLFVIGLELEPALLWRLRRSILGLGGLQVRLSMVLIGGGALALGLPWNESLALGSWPSPPPPSSSRHWARRGSSRPAGDRAPSRCSSSRTSL